MSSSYLEIIELEDGSYALQRMDSDGEPLVIINFSEEVSDYLKDHQVSVAKAMIGAGVQAAGALSKSMSETEDSDTAEGHTLH